MQVKRLKKGDTVKILSGREKGKTGKVLKIESDKNKLFVEKLNIVKKHQKPDAKGKGGIVEKEGSIDISNVMFLCNRCEAGVKVGFKLLDDGKKVRICKKCHELLDA
jgi:large subunit ribosomal protein L24